MAVEGAVSEVGQGLSNMTGGVLYVVATPIGNQGDLSPRAREILSAVDLVAAEDTRRSGRLLAALGIAKPMRSLHEHNEAAVVQSLVERLTGGASIALVSDAGTPLVSDPGFLLVRACAAAGLPVVPVPGPSALIAALSVSGLPTDRFRFEGFLPRQSARRREQLARLGDETATLVFYEAPHRLLETLGDMVEVFGAGRSAVLARELTKVHETVLRSGLGDLLERVRSDAEQLLGESVLVVAGASQEARDRVPEIPVDELLRTLLDYLPVKEAAAAAARLTGERKNQLYQRALALRAGA